MSVIYQTTITRIGQSAKEALGEQMLITFGKARRRISKNFASSIVMAN